MNECVSDLNPYAQNNRDNDFKNQKIQEYLFVIVAIRIATHGKRMSAHEIDKQVCDFLQ